MASRSARTAAPGRSLAPDRASGSSAGHTSTGRRTRSAATPPPSSGRCSSASTRTPTRLSGSGLTTSGTSSTRIHAPHDPRGSYTLKWESPASAGLSFSGPVSRSVIRRSPAGSGRLPKRRSDGEKRPAVSSQAQTTATLKCFFRFLVEEERLLRDPALPLRTPKKHEVLPDVLTMGELERLLTATGRPELWERHFHAKPERDRLLLALMAYAGLRRSELLGVDWDDLDLSRRLLKVRKA